MVLEDEDVDMAGLARDLMADSEARVHVGEPYSESGYGGRTASAVSPVSVDDADASSLFGESAPGTVIIFDWDDTLLASSWLARNGMGLDEPAIVPAHISTPMSALGASVYSLLTAAMEHGQVVIITNAETGWVELSAAKFMPEVLPLLPKMRVVSARSTYEPMFPDSPSDWKVAAFTQELSTAFSSKSKTLRRAASPPKRTVVSFGDSVYERTAVHAAAQRLGPHYTVLTKSIKFVERPSAEQVRRQVELVTGCLKDICTHEGALDLMLTIQLLQQHVEQQKQQQQQQRKGAATRAPAKRSAAASGTR